MLRKIGFVFVTASWFCLLRSPAPAASAELNGTVRSGWTWSPLPGAKVSLKLRGEVAYARQDGSFTLPFDLSAGLGASRSAPRTVLRNGRLDFQAAADGILDLELFDLAGKRVTARRVRVMTGERHRIDVTAMLAGLRGLGWLRMTGDGRTVRFRVFQPGSSDRALAGFAEPAGEAATGAAPRAAKRSAAGDALDTLRVDLAGYHSVDIPVLDGEPAAGHAYNVELMKDTRYTPDSATVTAWKDFFGRPVHRIVLNRNSVYIPGNSAGSVFVTAAGKEVDHWSTIACYPEPPPSTLRLVYSREGRTYHDTLDLAPFWAFHDSFRTRVDSLDPGNFRAFSTWSWPTGLSILPERDILEVFQARHMGGVHYHSHPDVSGSSGIRIDGPIHRYGEPDPRSGAMAIPDQTPVLTGYVAHFTLARREGHDLRVQLEWRPYLPQPAKFAFLNEWPVDGILRPGQVVRLQARLPPIPGGLPPAGTVPPPVENTYLEMSPRRAWDADHAFLDFAWRTRWDGSPLDWTFPFPVADTLSFRLRVRKEVFTYCDGLDESPSLKVVPDPADSSASAFEPNESDAEAPVVGKGTWHAAALDFRVGRRQDVDYFRFQGASGDSVRLSLRNLDGEDVNLYQEFAGPSSGLGLGRGQESSVEYRLPGDGTWWFRIEGRPGRYAFRVDKVE